MPSPTTIRAPSADAGPFSTERRASVRATWRGPILQTAIPAILTVGLFLSTVFLIAMPAFERHLRSTQQETARSVAEAVVSLLARLEHEVAAGRRDREQAQALALALVRTIRYGASGQEYLWVNDLEPRVIMHPYIEAVEGSSLMEIPDAEGRPLLLAFREVVDSPEQGGFVHYRWPRQDRAGADEDKVSYVKLFAPWGWIVGTGVYLDDVEARVDAMTRSLTRLSVIILAVIVALSIFMIGHAVRRERLRLSAERARREREQTLRAILDHTVQFIGMLAPDGEVLLVNRTALDFVGAHPRDIIGKPFWETPWWAGSAETRRLIREAIAGCRERAVPVVSHAQHTGSDGEVIEVDFSLSPILDADGQVVRLVAEGRDVTEAARLRQQLFQAQKLEAVGQLAGGVAHDFNNLLTSILGNAQFLHEEAAPGSEEAGWAAAIIRASGRAAELTGQLLAFSRKGKFQDAAVDMHEVIREVLALLECSVDKRIALRSDLAATAPVVTGDPTQLQSALLNLGLNARDAMPAGGTLTFATRNLPTPRGPVAADPPAAADDHLEITVTDTGTGIAPEVRQRIFEPFFTTKDPGRGTGLGLAGVYGCVTNHGGAIDVSSQPGAGSTFSVRLPTSDQPVATPDAPPAPLIRGAGRILVVEDEDAVRDLLDQALRRLGYETILCADGLAAEAVFREQADGIDLVILDLVMPRLGGAETFARLHAIASDVPVIIASGFSQNEAVEALRRAGAAGFLAKPYQLGQLSRTVQHHIRRSVAV